MKIQLLEDVDWGEVDLLVVDTLTMAQELHVTAALVVTTPQVISTDDVRRAIKMLQDVHIPIGAWSSSGSRCTAEEAEQLSPYRSLSTG